MSQEEVVHRSVPVACELVPGDRVPPVGVEASVGEVGDFGEEVEDAFPDYVPGLWFVSGGGLRGEVGSLPSCIPS